MTDNPGESSAPPPSDYSHRRRNALTGEWVLVSPHRLKRPWQGAQSDGGAKQVGPAYDPSCYLCPGNRRAEGAVNPRYEGVYVFPNDYPAIQPEAVAEPGANSPLFSWAPAKGSCRVICFSPDHSRTLSALTQDEVAQLVAEWCAQSAELGAQFRDGAVQIFENKGELMGCSNPHPHGQIWAQHTIPTLLRTELDHCSQHFHSTGNVLLTEYIQREIANDSRCVLSNEHFAVVVPFWATWPYETLICPRRSVARMPQLSEHERRGLADVVRRLSIRYDNLFGVSFPYSAGLHQAPANGEYDGVFNLHMHFYPPLLRSATVRKFMVGYEMLAEAQRDLTPEAAAQTLRALPDELVAPEHAP